MPYTSTHAPCVVWINDFKEQRNEKEKILQHEDEAQLDMLEVGSLTQAFRSHVLFKHSHILLQKRVYSKFSHKGNSYPNIFIMYPTKS